MNKNVKNKALLEIIKCISTLPKKINYNSKIKNMYSAKHKTVKGTLQNWLEKNLSKITDLHKNYTV